ncbi:Golgi-specific brefeldin A-resistance guanine nucleotide exchange factor 1-like [Glandiceps talaboti]
MATKISAPPNGIYIVQGEMSLVVTAMRRNSRWSSHSPQDEDQDPLLGNFSQLKEVINNISDLIEVEPNVFLTPFLDVIRSEDTTGPITGLALSSINKFLSYGLVDSSCEGAAAAIENMADAVTHARFVGTDPGSDEVVLMKILQVLRTLLLTPVGTLLTNESVCEIMQSCFRICFEMRLSELLRKSAEHTLMDMVQMLFSRLPYFKEEKLSSMRKLKMRAGGISESSRSKKQKKSPKVRQRKERLATSPTEDKEKDITTSVTYTAATTSTVGTATTTTTGNPAVTTTNAAAVATTTTTASSTAPVASVDISVQGSVTSGIDSGIDSKESSPDSEGKPEITVTLPDNDQKNDCELKPPEESSEMKKAGSDCDLAATDSEKTESIPEIAEDLDSVTEQSDSASVQDMEYVSSRGVRFTPQQTARDGSGPLIPHGLPCVRELFRFLISLISPHDRHNTDVMIHMGLSLLTVALETGSDHIGAYNALLCLVRDDMCKNLFFLLQSERLSLFAAALRVCFLLFESMREHLKFQLEMYLHRLMEIIISETPRIPYEQREMALESIVQLWRIPSLVTELYLNYDCDVYCSNLFEDLTKLLSKNAFPVSGLYTTHLLSLDALLTVIDSIEAHCHNKILSGMAAQQQSTQENQHSADKDKKHMEVTIHVEEIPEEDEEEKEGKVRTVSTTSADGEDSGTECDTQPCTAPHPTTSGYAMAQYIALQRQESKEDTAGKPSTNEIKRGRDRRSKFATNIPSPEELINIKQKKKLLLAGTEQFNQKASKGIAFLQEHGILKVPLEAPEVANFLRENPRLDKKMLGEFISAKKNVKVLDAFVRSFRFENTRIDEALRMYLEAFRLPGEAPVIQHLMEVFSEQWHNANHQPFVNCDAAFTLAYAVIMLNVDQHNYNAKKQNIPMTVEEFKKNVKNCNGGQDFDGDMLDEVYNAVKNEEIVMPAEQTGLVKELYLWRVLLKRGAGSGCHFKHVPSSSFDQDLFMLTWGPTVAAISYVFDKSLDETIIQRAISGFRKCAMISAHYGLSDVFDNLIISLCKFTTLLNPPESMESLPVVFGSNVKAQLAAKTVFALAHRHGDILREGWKNILDCMLQLYRAKLLPKVMVEVEDFVDPSGKISLIREEIPTMNRTDSSIFSSFYQYITLNPEPANQRGPTAEDQESTQQAHGCIKECHPEQLVTESKFLRLDSLQELIKALTFASSGPETAVSLGIQYDEEAAVFYLELLIRVILQNRDRVSSIWQGIRDHLYNLIVNVTEYSMLVDRAVVGVLRLAIRLLRREEIAPQVLTSLRILLMMKPHVMYKVCRQIAFGMHELLRTNAANIHSSSDWMAIFTIMNCVGAGMTPPQMLQYSVDVDTDVPPVVVDSGAQSDSELSTGSYGTANSERGYTSDSELYETQQRVVRSATDTDLHDASSSSTGGWLLVGKEGEIEQRQHHGNHSHSHHHHHHHHHHNSKKPFNQYEIAIDEELHQHDTKSLMKCCESLAFLVRDAAHVTPDNFESCVHCIRVFVEASVNGGRLSAEYKKHKHAKDKDKAAKHRKKQSMKKSKTSPAHLSKMLNDSEENDDGPPGGYQALSIQLLDLMHTLHTRAATIFSSWAEEQEREGIEDRKVDAGASALWIKCWCPLLQGIARLCCDVRRQVRMSALTYLQRALLVHDLKTLSAVEWESCFNKVLFPLLSKLLENINAQDPVGMEETRMRSSTLLCKVFLQHLTPLLSLPTFTALWLTILDFMDKYMHKDKSDLLSEAIPESLKNMLLVMDTARVFNDMDEDEERSQLWEVTWERIDCFLPGLKNEVFKPQETVNPKPVKLKEVTEPPNQDTIIPREGSPSPPPPEENSIPSELNQVGPEQTGGNIILQPPLPALSGTVSNTSTVGSTGSVPILLNPQVMQGAPLPILAVTQSPSITTDTIQ